eukprot:gene11674-11817_t
MNAAMPPAKRARRSSHTAEPRVGGVVADAARGKSLTARQGSKTIQSTQLKQQDCVNTNTKQREGSDGEQVLSKQPSEALAARTASRKPSQRSKQAPARLQDSVYASSASSSSDDDADDEADSEGGTSDGDADDEQQPSQQQQQNKRQHRRQQEDDQRVPAGQQKSKQQRRHGQRGQSGTLQKQIYHVDGTSQSRGRAASGSAATHGTGRQQQPAVADTKKGNAVAVKGSPASRRSNAAEGRVSGSGASDQAEGPEQQQRKRGRLFKATSAAAAGDARPAPQLQQHRPGKLIKSSTKPTNGAAAAASVKHKAGTPSIAKSAAVPKGGRAAVAKSQPGRGSAHAPADPSSPGNSAKTAKRKHNQLSKSPPAAAAADKRGRRRPIKGPLASVLAAENTIGPGSSNTTTSTRGVGGANRPIKELTSYHQAVRRVNHQIQRISTEEHLLQTYAADGWKGASREKVRLTDELRRAELTVARCKEVIRQSLRYCEAVSDSEVIPKEAVDSDGEVDVSDIFCAKCKESRSSDDNDLVLCDGPCNRAYHECCLQPRLVAADIPEDEGWLCPACDAKMDILHQINDYFGTEYEIETSWQDLFNESPEEQEALRLARLKSGSLESPRAAAGAMAAAVAAVMANGTSAGGQSKPRTYADLMAAEWPSDEDDEDYSSDSGGSSGAVVKRRKLSRRRVQTVDYKQLHEQLFGFAAFDGDDDVFREEEDEDYESP